MILGCYICNHSEYRIRAGSVRDNPSLKIHECRNCGLVSLDGTEHIKSGHYEESGMHGEEPLPMEEWLRNAEEDDQRRFEMLKNEMVNSKLLDFGSGAGGFVRKAQTLASMAVGIELESRVRKYWDGTLTIYPGLEKAEKDFDLITSFHVVEHLPDPRGLIRNLSEHLRSGGRMVLEVPSSEDALLTLYENEAFQGFTYWSNHLYLFNAETLRLLCTQAGMKVLSIRQYQRYPLSNHLYWLSQGKPGGHKYWSFLDTKELSEAFAASLAAIGKCDTVIAFLEKE